MAIFVTIVLLFVTSPFQDAQDAPKPQPPDAKAGKPERDADDAQSKNEKELAEDQAVLELVLADLIQGRVFSIGRDVPRAQAQIVVGGSTPEKSGMLAAAQIKGELKSEPDREIPKDAASDLVERNRWQHSWEEWKPTSDKIVVANLAEFSLKKVSRDHDPKPWLFEKHPNAIAWVEAWRPGYSADRKTVVVQLRIGPSPHGACGTYLLVREEEKWKIKWRNIALFA